MKLNKKLMVIVLLVLLVATGIAATRVNEDTGYKNLKVLPKNISSKALSHIMIDEFEDGLGVGCSYCHAKENNSNKLDYASDAKPEKEIARKMMKMTVGINEKYFQLKHVVVGDSTLIITCNTCHNGIPQPADANQ